MGREDAPDRRYVLRTIHTLIQSYGLNRDEEVMTALAIIESNQRVTAETLLALRRLLARVLQHRYVGSGGPPPSPC